MWPELALNCYRCDCNWYGTNVDSVCPVCGECNDFLYSHVESECLGIHSPGRSYYKEKYERELEDMPKEFPKIVFEWRNYTEKVSYRVVQTQYKTDKGIRGMVFEREERQDAMGNVVWQEVALDGFPRRLISELLDELDRFKSKTVEKEDDRQFDMEKTPLN